ncbi:HNH endonuclease [Pseudomonas luteola]
MALRSLKPCNAPGCRELVRGVRYCKAHEHLAEAWKTSKRSAKPGLSGRPWRRKREQILIRDCYTCQSCGLVTKELEVDHIIGRASGGSDDDSNLQSLCIPCHKLKTQKESLAAR